MSNEPGDPRGRTVRVAPWWKALARRRIEELRVEASKRQPPVDLTQEQLAAEIGVSPSTMTRLLGDNVNVKWVGKLASRLGLPRPVFIPQSEAEARAIEHMLADMNARLAAQDAALATISHVVRSHDPAPAEKSPRTAPRRPRARRMP